MNCKNLLTNRKTYNQKTFLFLLVIKNRSDSEILKMVMY